MKSITTPSGLGVDTVSQATDALMDTQLYQKISETMGSTPSL